MSVPTVKESLVTEWSCLQINTEKCADTCLIYTAVTLTRTMSGMECVNLFSERSWRAEMMKMYHFVTKWLTALLYDMQGDRADNMEILFFHLFSPVLTHLHFCASDTYVVLITALTLSLSQQWQLHTCTTGFPYIINDLVKFWSFLLF